MPLTKAPPSLQTSPKKSSKVSSPKRKPLSAPSTLTPQQRPAHSSQLQSPQQHEPATIPSIPQQPRPQSVPLQTIREYPPYPSAAQYCAPSSSKSFIVGDSHIKRVDKDMLKYHITNSSEKVYTKCFDGAKANKICRHMLTTLYSDRPSGVVIHAGTNDVHENARATDVAKKSIEIGVMCKSFGINDISISSVLPRKDISLNKIIDEINNLLKNMCEFNSFKFIFHKNIDLNMLCHNNLHLRPVGTFLLTKNFADVFNGAD